MGLYIIPAMCALHSSHKGVLTSISLEIFCESWGREHLAPSTEKSQRKPDEQYNMSTQIRNVDGHARILQNVHEPKINMLKGGYSVIANLIFQSWLKDIQVHVEDCTFSHREKLCS